MIQEIMEKYNIDIPDLWCIKHNLMINEYKNIPKKVRSEIQNTDLTDFFNK